jgi:hypothetical protein
MTDQNAGLELEEVELVEVEDYGREGRRPPPARRYAVKIDGQRYVFEQRIVTGAELLKRAGRTPPERWQLDKRVRGGKFIPIALGDKVDLGEPGIEVFETFPLDEREG